MSNLQNTAEFFQDLFDDEQIDTQKLYELKFNDYIKGYIYNRCLQNKKSEQKFMECYGIDVFTLLNTLVPDSFTLHEICKILDLDMDVLSKKANKYADFYVSHRIDKISCFDKRKLFLEEYRIFALLKIRQFREIKNQNILQFAKNCNLRKDTMRNIEVLFSNPQLKTLVRIVNYMGVSMQELFNNTNEQIQRNEVIDIEKLKMALAKQVQGYCTNKNESVEVFAKQSKITEQFVTHLQINGEESHLTSFLNIVYYMKISPQDFFRETESIMFNL